MTQHRSASILTLLACSCGAGDATQLNTPSAARSVSGASGVVTGTATLSAGTAPAPGVPASHSQTLDGRTEPDVSAAPPTTGASAPATHTSSGAPPEPTASAPEPTDERTPDAAVDASIPSSALGTPIQVELAPTRRARSEHGVGALNGEVYVLGGFTPTVTDSVEVYSPATDTWRDVASFPDVFHHPNVGAVGGKLFVLGFHAGSGQRMADGRAFAYDPQTDEWTPRAPQPAGSERGASCVAVYKDKIYLFGGTNDVALHDASVYDPADDSWQPLPELPIHRHHCIAAAVKDKIYIVSGRDVVIEEVQPESYIFDPVTLAYEPAAPILTPRGGAAGGALDGRIYVFGGEGNPADPSGIFHQGEVYDTATDSWASLPDMVVPRHGLGGAVIGDRIYLPGGSTHQGIESSTTNTVFYLATP